MAIAPDDKDWTWILERPCPECGYESAAVDRTALAARIDAASSAWREVLTAPGVRERPDDATWSPLEYAAHVRDVHLVFVERVQRMLREVEPTFANWDQDESAIAGRYNELDPTTVGQELSDAGRVMGALYARVPDDGWDRPGLRSNGSAFTVDSIARYHLHDIEHHLWDVAR